MCLYFGLAGLILLLELIGDMISGGVATLIRIALSATAVALYIIGFLEDVYDTNTIVG